MEKTCAGGGMRMEALRVGVCEDRPEDLRALLRLLAGSPLPCETETFTCGEAFLRRFYPGRYDLVLVDPRMGGAEGLETVSRLRERDGGVPVAFYSSGLEHAAEGYRLRVDRYLTRPCAPEDLGELWDDRMLLNLNEPGDYEKLRLELGE